MKLSFDVGLLLTMPKSVVIGQLQVIPENVLTFFLRHSVVNILSHFHKTVNLVAA